MKLKNKLIGVVAVFVSVTAFAQTPVPLPDVEGPITGPGEMQPAIRPGPEGTNLDDFDYIVEEYFISGTTASGARYKTRLLIRKPSNPQKFSGVVVAEPTHRGGNGLICQFARYGIGQRGHACMTVAARTINLSNPATAGAGLYEFNLERYGSLFLANSQTNEIIAQAGRLMRANLSGGVMQGYPVTHVVLGGTSDSSGATRTYMTTGSMADHRTLRMPDGSPIYQGFFVTSTLGDAIVPITDVPTIQMPSQSEVHGSSTWGWRRPDSDVPGNQFRLYEVAGMSHNDARENPAFTDCTHTPFHFPHGALTFMGLQHTLDWVTDGRLPPHAAVMETDGDTSDGTRVALDGFGNAKGGVRTTYLDIPLFTFHIPNAGPGLCSQTGWVSPLSEEQMDALYKNYGQYVSKVEHRLKELMDQGWFPKEYRSRYVQGDLKLYPK